MAKRVQATPARKPVSVFATAKKVAPQQNGSTPAEELVPVEQIEYAVALKVVREQVEALEKTVRGEIYTGFAYPRWLKEVLTLHRRPDNFRGVDTANKASQASVECRKRGTNSPLKPEEVELLESKGIPYEHAPMKKGTSSFALNPKYENDPRLQEWGEKMAEIGMPEDLFVVATKPVVTEDTLSSIWKLNDPDVISQLMMVATVPALKPVGGVTLERALEVVASEVKRGSKAVVKAEKEEELRGKLRASAGK